MTGLFPADELHKHSCLLSDCQGTVRCELIDCHKCIFQAFISFHVRYRTAFQLASPYILHPPHSCNCVPSSNLFCNHLFTPAQPEKIDACPKDPLKRFPPLYMGCFCWLLSCMQTVLISACCRGLGRHSIADHHSHRDHTRKCHL